MNQKTKHILISFILIALAAVLFWFLRNEMGDGKRADFSDLPKEVAQNVKKISNSKNIFEHPTLAFSFEYLSEYSITELNDDGGGTILLQKNGKGTQIYITDFYYSDLNFNAEFVKKELEGEKVSDLKDIMAKGNFSAVSFASSDPSLGDTLEIWFVKDSKLYQITTQLGNEKLAETVIDSWKFQ